MPSVWGDVFLCVCCGALGLLFPPRTQGAGAACPAPRAGLPRRPPAGRRCFLGSAVGQEVQMFLPRSRRRGGRLGPAGRAGEPRCSRAAPAAGSRGRSLLRPFGACCERAQRMSPGRPSVQGELSRTGELIGESYLNEIIFSIFLSIAVFSFLESNHQAC